MRVVNFETAKKLREFFGVDYSPWSIDGCNLLYVKNDEQLIDWNSVEADKYLRDKESFYPAPYIQEVIEYFEEKYGISIYITPRFDMFDKATQFEIYRNECSDSVDYSSDHRVGDRYESANRAIIETCNLLNDIKMNK